MEFYFAFEYVLETRESFLWLGFVFSLQKLDRGFPGTPHVSADTIPATHL
jgi:hypothetical protein